MIISDYGKNSLNENIIKYAIKISKKNNVISIVDPSKTLKNYSCYSGADFITPNLLELRNLYLKLDNENKDIVEACKNLKKKYSKSWRITLCYRKYRRCKNRIR